MDLSEPSFNFFKMHFMKNLRLILEPTPLAPFHGAIQCNLKEKVFLPYSKAVPLEKVHQTVDFSYLVGIFTISRCDFLVYAKEVRLAGSLGQEQVYEITKVQWVSLQTEKKENEIVQQQLGLLCRHLEVGFYFSFSMSLNQCFQKHHHFTGEFYCNESQQAFLQNEKLQQWRVPMINGYFREFTDFNQKKIVLVVKMSLKEPYLVELNVIQEGEELTMEKYFLSQIKMNLKDALSTIGKKDKVLILNCEQDSAKWKQGTFFVENEVQKIDQLIKGQFKYCVFPQINEKLFDFIERYQLDIQSFRDIQKTFGKTVFSRENIKIQSQEGFICTLFHKHVDSSSIFLLCSLIISSLDPKFVHQRKSLKLNVVYKELFDMFNSLNFQLRDMFSSHLQQYTDLKLKELDGKQRNRLLMMEMFLETQSVSWRSLDDRLLLSTQLFSPRELPFTKNFSMEEFYTQQTRHQSLNSIENTMLFITFNAAGYSPLLAQLKPLIDTIESKKPGIIYIGIQEVIELKVTVYNIVKYFQNQSFQEWVNTLSSTLPQYSLIYQDSMLTLGSILLV